MCGRYSLHLRPAQIRQMLEDENMPVDEAPEDEGEGTPRQSYNFAPGYHGIVYRADVPDWGAGPRRQHKKASDEAEAAEETEEQTPSRSDDDSEPPHYKMQSMKWGLIPFWTKRNPDYGSMMKTINCRDDSLAQSGGMWSSMKARKRCIVVADGFYEWLKKDGSKDKIPHFTKRKDGKLMCFAGLWDVVTYDNDEQKNYTYTIITTDSNKQLRFLHDRMPVILENGSEELRTWLDPKRHEWTRELQSLLKPFKGELEIYPVSKEVGKVGNNSPTFIVPLDSTANKSNIANFFAKGNAKTQTQLSSSPKKEQPKVEVKKETSLISDDQEEYKGDLLKGTDTDGEAKVGVKREAEEPADSEPPRKTAMRPSPTKPSPSPQKLSKSSISATKNSTKSPVKPKQPGSQKITKFFSNSS